MTETCAELFEHAAELIDTYGLNAGVGGNVDYGFCMLGAMRHELGLNPEHWSCYGSHRPPGWGKTSEEELYNKAALWAQGKLGVSPWLYSDLQSPVASDFGDKAHMESLGLTFQGGKDAVVAKLRELADKAKEEGL